MTDVIQVVVQDQTPIPVTVPTDDDSGDSIAVTVQTPATITPTIIGVAGPQGGAFQWMWVTVTTSTTGSDGQGLLANATSNPITITLPTPDAGAQILAAKTDSSVNPVTVTGFDALTVQNQSGTYIADGTQWRQFMAYTPGLGSVVSQINQLKQSALQANVTQAGSATPISPAAAGTEYEITGSTSQSIVLPNPPSGGTTVIGVKCGPSYTGTITVTCQSGDTIDGQSSFTLTGAGQQNIFEIGNGQTDWQVA